MAQAKIEIIADVKKAVSSLNTLETQGKKSLDSLNSTFSVLKGAAAAFVGAFAFNKIVSGLESTVSAAIEAEDAFNGLKSALALSGQFSAESAKELDAFTESIEKNTKFTQEQAQEVAALGLSYGLSIEETKKLTKVSADLAAVTGTDLRTATEKLLKTYDGEIGKIDNLDSSIKGLTKQQLAQGAVLDILGKKYENAGSAGLGTFSGQLNQLQKSLGNVSEEFGKALISSTSFTTSLGELTAISQSVIKAISDNKDTISSLANTFVSLVKIGIQGVLEGFKIFVIVVREVDKNFSGLIDTVVVGFEKLAKLSALVGGPDFTKGIKDFRTFLDPKGIDKGYEGIIKTVDDLSSAFSVTSKEINKSKNSAQSLDDVFKKTSDGVGRTSENARLLALNAAEATKKTEELRKITDKQAEIYKTILGENKKLTTEISNQGAEQNEIIQNNLKLALEQLDVKKNELKMQGLLNSAIEDQIAAQKGLLSSKAREDILSQKPEADPNFGKEQTKKDNQFISDDTISTIGAAFGEGAGAIAASISSFVTPLTSFMGAAEAVVGVAQKLIDFIPNLLNSVANVFTSLTELPKKLFEAISNVFNSLTGLIGDLLGNIVSSLGDIILSAFTFLLDGIPNALIKLAQSLPDIIAEAVPKLIDGIIKLAENLGPLVEKLVIALADAMPLIVDSLVDSLITRGGILKISYALAKALIVDVPLGLARGFANSLSSIASGIFPGFGKLFSSGIKFPTPTWISRLKIATPEWLGKFTTALSGGKLVTILEGIANQFQPLIDAIRAITGQGGGGFVGKLTKGDIGGAIDTGLGGDKRRKILGFAEGGAVPSGFPNDSFPARLTSGENVVDRSTNEKLNAFLDGERGGPVQIILKVGEQELANIIYNLNKKGFRLA